MIYDRKTEESTGKRKLRWISVLNGADFVALKCLSSRADSIYITRHCL